MAMKLCSWLEDFQFIENIWIDFKELKPGMKLESFFDGFNKSDIVIVIVSKFSKDSEYVKKEIEYSLEFQDRKEKIVIPVLYKIKPVQIPLHNRKHRNLLKNIYVQLDENPYSIHKIIPSLIPDHNPIEILFDRDFHIDISRLVDNLRSYSERGGKLYPLIDHERFDRQIGLSKLLVFTSRTRATVPVELCILRIEQFCNPTREEPRLLALLVLNDANDLGKADRISNTVT